MKIITVSFDFPGKDSYERLLDVFVFSARKNMPHCDIEIIKTSPPKKADDRSTGLVTNTAKLALWIDAMNRTDEDFIFMDCDMLIIRDMSDAFEHDFDIGYTERHPVRNNKRIPINGGVMFIKNNERSRQFLQRMMEINDEMYVNPNFHGRYRMKYAGMNQSAFGYMLENPKEHNAKLKAFPCQIYNVCNTEWHIFDENSRAIHYKSALRRAALGQPDRNITPMMTPFVKLWKFYESEMLKESPKTKPTLDKMLKEKIHAKRKKI